MKKGTLIIGVLVGFTYVGQETKYCKVSIRTDNGAIHKGIAGTADLFPFSTMLSLKGAGAQVQMEYDGKKGEYEQYRNVEFVLE